MKTNELQAKHQNELNSFEIAKLIHSRVMHKTFGRGLIILESFNNQLNSNILEVEFENNITVSFPFPSCFINNSLELENVDLELAINSAFSKKTELQKIKQQDIIRKVANLKLEQDLACNHFLMSYYNNTFKILKDETEDILYKVFRKGSLSRGEKNIVVFTISWISFLNYDGEFWSYLRNELSNLYAKTRKILELDDTIRKVINEQDKYENSRRITNFLVHAGIPKNYLKRFYDFVFDIYKVNFNYQIVGQPVEKILLDSFEGLSSLLLQNNSDNDKLKLNVTQKTYVLIKSTKLALVYYRSGMVKLVKMMLEIVDFWYYSISSFDDNKYPQFLNETFNDWKDENPEKRIVENRKNYDYISKPQFFFNTETRILKIRFPIFRLRGITKDDLNNISVELCINNQKVLLDNNQFKIVEKIGFNTIEISPQIVNEFSTIISLTVLKDKIPIISEYLKRSFIIFDENGKERSNNKDYDKLVYVLYPKNLIFSGSKQPKIIKENNGFNIAVFIANNNNIYNCGSELVCFSSMLKSGIYGLEKSNVICFNGERKCSVFNQVNNFVFESELDVDNLLLKINSKSYELRNLDIKKTNRGSYWNYNLTFDMNMISNNINTITIFSKENNLQEVRSETFLIDKDLNFKISDTDIELIKDIEISSSFKLNTNKVIGFSFSNNTFFECDFRLGNTNLSYIINPQIKRYKWELEDDWRILDTLEMQCWKTLFLTCIKNNTLSILNKDGICLLSSVPYKNKNGYSEIDTLFLSQLKSGNEYVTMNISDVYGHNVQTQIYLKQVVISINIKSVNEMGVSLKLDIKNFQPNSLNLRIRSIEGRDIFNLVISYQEIDVINIQPFTKYRMEIFEKGNIFSGTTSKFIYKSYLYYKDGNQLSEEEFYIKEVSTYSFDFDKKGEWIETKKMCKFKK